MVMIEFFRKVFKKRFLDPILVSDAPEREGAKAVGVGIFFGLTPTMGIQMYIVAVIWAFCRWAHFYNFNLPVAVATVWITNPLTVIPIYYVFLATGSLVLNEESILSYEFFQNAIVEIGAAESGFDSLLGGMKFLFVDLGWPMLVGSLFYAIPGAVVGQSATFRLLMRRRKTNPQIRVNTAHEVS